MDIFDHIKVVQIGSGLGRHDFLKISYISSIIFLSPIKNEVKALVCEPQLVGHCPLHQRVAASTLGMVHAGVAGSIPVKGAVCRKQLIGVSLSH